MVKVLFLKEFRQPPASLTELCPKVEIPNFPEVAITGAFRRKFMVVAGSEPGEMIVVIGPVMGDYYHRQILSDPSVPQGNPLGGGYVYFNGNLQYGKMRWSAKFCDSSGDYGVFTPEILTREERQAVADALQMSTRFEWEKQVTPQKPL